MLRCDCQRESLLTARAGACSPQRPTPACGARSRSGFTQIELLAAIAIIGILASLLLPAVQSAREASRRTQCQSNLHNMGVAIAGYESSHGRLPPCTGSLKTPGPLVASQYSAHAMLLGYVDQTPLANLLVDEAAQFLSQDDDDVMPPFNTVIPVFLCPSDSIDLGTNFRVCTGGGTSTFDEPGAFSAIHKGMQVAEIIDGLSNTAAMSERIKSDLNTQSFDSKEDYWFSGANDVYGLPLTTQQMIDVCASLTGPPPAYDPRVGHLWHLTWFGSTMYNHAVGPNARIADCSGQTRPPFLQSANGVHKASSRHPGGVHVLMADGAVRFVSDAIDISVWRSLGRLADGA